MFEIDKVLEIPVKLDSSSSVASVSIMSPYLDNMGYAFYETKNVGETEFLPYFQENVYSNKLFPSKHVILLFVNLIKKLTDLNRNWYEAKVCLCRYIFNRQNVLHAIEIRVLIS